MSLIWQSRAYHSLKTEIMKATCKEIHDNFWYIRKLYRWRNLRMLLKKIQEYITTDGMYLSKSAPSVELIMSWYFGDHGKHLFFALHFCYQWNKNTSFRQGSQPTGVFQVEKSTTSARIRASDPDVETSRFWLFDYPGIIKNGLFSLKPIKPRFNENLRKYWRNKSKHPCILGLITDILYYFTDPSCRVHNFVP